ncbi:MAG: hypothetical protein LUO98_08275 [Methanoregula sp.]|nr:hypothetical protein [Methanoregula sp.]
MGESDEKSVNETVSGAGPEDVSAEKSTVIPDAPAMRKDIPIIVAIKKNFNRLHSLLFL